MKRPLWHITQIIKRDVKTNCKQNNSHYKMHFLNTDSINRLKKTNIILKKNWFGKCDRPPAITLVSVCKASVQNRVVVVNVSALGGGRVEIERGEGVKVSFWSLNWYESRSFFRVSDFNFAFVLLWYVRQLCGLPAKVSLVQIGCQLLGGGWRGRRRSFSWRRRGCVWFGTWDWSGRRKRKRRDSRLRLSS